MKPQTVKPSRQESPHSLTNDLAGELTLSEVIPTAEEMQKIVDSIGEGRHRRPVFVFAADGAMAPISETPRTPHYWKEIRGIRGYLLDDDHIVHVLSWHQIGSKQDFIYYLQQKRSKNFIPLDKVRLCFIADGAQWIWDSIQEVYPEYREVLDYFTTQNIYINSLGCISTKPRLGTGSRRPRCVFFTTMPFR